MWLKMLTEKQSNEEKETWETEAQRKIVIMVMSVEASMFWL